MLVAVSAVLLVGCSSAPPPPRCKPITDVKGAQDTVFNAGANIYYACSNCHVRYIDEIKNVYPNGPPDVIK